MDIDNQADFKEESTSEVAELFLIDTESFSEAAASASM